MRKFFWFLLAAAAIAGGVLWSQREKPVEVQVHVLARGTVQANVSNTRVGTVKACDRAFLSPAAAGQVDRVLVKEGDRVKTGEVLLEVWNDDREAELRLAETEVRAARARATEACVIAAGALRERKRIEGLSNRQLVSEEVLDRASTDALSSKAACDGAQAAIAVSVARIDVARQALERTRLRAPFDGVIAELEARLGEYLTPSPPGIATLPAVDLIDASCLYVSAPIDEVDAPLIAEGMSACVTLDAFENRRCGGTVRRIAPYVLDREKQARTVEVEVVLTAPEDMEGLLTGYSADIEILIDEHDNVLRVPSEAILENNRVLVLNPDTQMLEERSFEAGLGNWQFTEAISGLQAGDQIILNAGAEGVQAGVSAVVAP